MRTRISVPKTNTTMARRKSGRGATTKPVASRTQAGAGPRKENPEREEDDGENDLPGLRMAQPELALPQEGVANGDDNHAPAGAPVDVLGGIAAAFDQGEGRHPKEPSGDENGVSVVRHGRNCSAIFITLNALECAIIVDVVTSVQPNMVLELQK